MQYASLVLNGGYMEAGAEVAIKSLSGTKAGVKRNGFNLRIWRFDE